MKTLAEFVKDNKSKCLDGRDYTRLLNYCSWEEIPLIMPYENLKEEYNSKEAWEKVGHKEWTKENILKDLERDVAFGFEKALNRRGISSGLMFEVVRMWNNILEEGLENWSDDNYAMYGLPLFKSTAVKYGFDNPIGDDTGEEDYYNEDEDYSMY